MDKTTLSGIEALSDLALRDGVDMRPTLLRVLTDLYAQKLTHTPEEERHYTELTLRLLDTVDAATRADVAARLANHLSPPVAVIARLAAELREPAFSPAEPPADTSDGMPEDFLEAPEPDATKSSASGYARAASHGMPPDVAAELSEVFFAANADERRLILLNIDSVTSLGADSSRLPRDATVGTRLETAALARKREDFALHLTNALHISRELAKRIAIDESGEPIVVAAKALGVPRDVLYRILLFINTTVGHSVERVHALATLYDELNTHAAQHMVAIWQALDTGPTAHDAARRVAPARADSEFGRRDSAARRPGAPVQADEKRKVS